MVKSEIPPHHLAPGNLGSPTYNNSSWIFPNPLTPHSSFWDRQIVYSPVDLSPRQRKQLRKLAMSRE
jgi:hypothetical protein